MSQRRRRLTLKSTSIRSLTRTDLEAVLGADSGPTQPSCMDCPDTWNSDTCTSTGCEGPTLDAANHTCPHTEKENCDNIGQG